MAQAHRIRPRRAVEAGEEAVAGGVDLAAGKPNQLSAHQRVVLLEEFAPSAVPEFGQLRGGAHDVGEQDGGENAIGLDDVPLAPVRDATQEPLDFSRYLLRLDPVPMIHAG